MILASMFTVGEFILWCMACGAAFLVWLGGALQ